MPVFTGNEGSIISKTAAKNLTANFQSDFPNERKGYFYGKSKLLAILNQDGCVGIRIYFGKEDEEGEETKPIQLILVGTDEDGDDQSGSSHTILEFGTPCPSDCSTPSEAVG
ncbi:MAG: hypothetical protein GYB31_13470 [Bacteroidetes bacterium]|nr:hypothetical protein [Bacteroidota bacterium]